MYRHDLLDDFFPLETAIGYPDPLEDVVGVIIYGSQQRSIGSPEERGGSRGIIVQKGIGSPEERASAKGIIVQGEDFVGDAFGGALGSEAIPWSQAEAFNAEVEHVNTDVTAWAQPEVSRQVVLLEWQRFYMPWRAWFAQADENLPAIGRFLAGERLKAFREQQRQFAELLRSLKERGVQTSAAAPDTRGWLERLLSGDGSAKPLIPWWVWALGATVLVGPTLATLVGSGLMLKGKLK